MAFDWRGLVGAKTVDQLVQQAFERLRDAGSAITNLNIGGVFRTFIELFSQGLADLYDLLATVVPQGYVQSASGAWLDLKAADLGLTRLAARRTVGVARFYRSTSDGNVTIPAGVVVATKSSPQGDRLRYVVTQPVLLPEGQTSAPVAIEAERPGARYNVAPGLITELVTHVEGVHGVINDVPEGQTTWINQEGSDQETDEALRTRCLLRWAELGRGATRDAYIAWAMAVPGVSDVAVDDRFPRGDGTVDVIIMGPSGPPSAELIAAVQAYINARKPICSDVLVRGPDLVQRSVRLRAYIPIEAGDTEATQAQILDLLNSLLATGERPEAPRLTIGQWPYRARLAALGMMAPDVFNVVVELPAQDENLAVDELFVPGLVQVVVERAHP